MSYTEDYLSSNLIEFGFFFFLNEKRKLILEKNKNYLKFKSFKFQRLRFFFSFFPFIYFTSRIKSAYLFSFSLMINKVNLLAKFLFQKRQHL